MASPTPGPDSSAALVASASESVSGEQKDSRLCHHLDKSSQETIKVAEEVLSAKLIGVYMSSAKFQCSVCSYVAPGEPKKICNDCHLQLVKTRHLAHELGRRLGIGYADVYECLRNGINKLVDRINSLTRLVEK